LSGLSKLNAAAKLIAVRSPAVAVGVPVVTSKPADLVLTHSHVCGVNTSFNVFDNLAL